MAWEGMYPVMLRRRALACRFVESASRFVLHDVEERIFEAQVSAPLPSGGSKCAMALLGLERYSENRQAATSRTELAPRIQRISFLRSESEHSARNVDIQILSLIHI